MVSPTSVGREWCGVTGPPNVDPASAQPRLVSGLLRGDPLCDCVMLRNGIGAISSGQRASMAVISEGSDEQTARCWIPGCSGPDASGVMATRPPVRSAECHADFSICEQTTRLDDDRFEGSVKIQQFIDMRCGKQPGSS